MKKDTLKPEQSVSGWDLLRKSKDQKIRINGLCIIGGDDKSCIELPYGDKLHNEVEIRNNTFLIGDMVATSKIERLLMVLHVIPKYELKYVRPAGDKRKV